MKINKTDLKNLSLLKLFHMNMLSGDDCLSQINFGNRTRERTQDRYLQKLIKILSKIPKEDLDDVFIEQNKEILGHVRTED